MVTFTDELAEDTACAQANDTDREAMKSDANSLVLKTLRCTMGVQKQKVKARTHKTITASLDSRSLVFDAKDSSGPTKKFL